MEKQNEKQHTWKINKAKKVPQELPFVEIFQPVFMLGSMKTYALIPA